MKNNIKHMDDSYKVNIGSSQPSVYSLKIALRSVF